MIPFAIMLMAIAVSRVAGMFGVAAQDDWPAATRAGLAVMFVFTGIAHFTGTRQDMVRMVPPALPSPALLVTLTGVAELAGAAGLLTPGYQSLAAWCLMALLVAVFPANVYASQANVAVAGRPPSPLVFRLPLQVLWIALLWWSMPQ
jgi:uncharacterized membrane protein